MALDAFELKIDFRVALCGSGDSWGILEGFGRVVAVDVKNEIKNLVMYAKCQQDAATFGSARAANGYGQLVGQSLDNIGRWADMAEAAIAYAEYQVNDGWDANVDGASYIRERGKLWDAFMEARAKAANQQ